MKTKPKLSLNYLVGIDVPNHIKEEINFFLQKYAASFSQDLKWINFNEYHITIAYLGKITEHQRERLIGVTDRLSLPPFSIEIQGLGFFPPGSNPKFLRVGINNGREEMNIFAENVRQKIAKEAGLIPKNKFYPFITVGEIINPFLDKKNIFNFISENWDYPFGGFKIDNFHLYRLNKSQYVHNHKIKLKKSKYKNI
ncbi:MAG: RNA 2',3'-cyclic phosphodiesterase [Bacillota bacterium]